MSGTGANNTIVSGWPDAILCTNPGGGTFVFLPQFLPYSDGLFYYVFGGGGYYITFNANGTFNSISGVSTTNCSVSHFLPLFIRSGFSISLKARRRNGFKPGSSAYYNAGNVGIGTANPSTTLQKSMELRVTTAAVVSGNLTTTQVTETAVNLGSSLSGTVTLNLSSGTYFYGTVTGTTTFAASNIAASGSVSSFTLELTNGGSQTVNWMANTRWPSGLSPLLTTSGVDILVCSTRDAGANWRCVASELNSQ